MSEGSEIDARRELLAAARGMAEAGLVAGTSGNASSRLGPGRVLVTPTGLPYGVMEERDLVVVDRDGCRVEGRHAPSSEVRAHLAVYRARPDVGSVMHTHSTFASVCAVAGLEVPPVVDELVARAGGAVPVAPYARPGTWELGRVAAEALGRGGAVLLRSHGLVAAGAAPREALDLALLVERVAQVFVYARLLGNVDPPPGQAAGGFVDTTRRRWYTQS